MKLITPTEANFSTLACFFYATLVGIKYAFTAKDFTRGHGERNKSIKQASKKESGKKGKQEQKASGSKSKRAGVRLQLGLMTLTG